MAMRSTCAFTGQCDLQDESGCSCVGAALPVPPDANIRTAPAGASSDPDSGGGSVAPPLQPDLYL